MALPAARALIHCAAQSALQALPPAACFLGLDVSLSRTGLALLDARGRALRVAAASPPAAQRSAVLWGGAALSAAIRDVCAQRTVCATLVEDFLQTFEGGGSSSHTRFTLARMNGIGAFEAWRHTGAPVLWAYPTSMRAYFHVGKEAPGSGGGAAGAAAATPARHRVASRAKAKAAVGGFVRWAHPALHASGGGGGAAEDEADALLAAMYCLAQEVEWRALRAQDGAAFWGLLDAKLPTARLGRQGPAGAAPRNAVRAALVGLHEAALASEGARRAAPGGGGGGGGGSAEAAAAEAAAAAAAAGAAALPVRRKPRRSKTDSAAALAALAAASPLPDPLALERLYKRQRLAFSEEVRSVLLEGPGALWPAGSA
jgi:hypothetical protein